MPFFQLRVKQKIQRAFEPLVRDISHQATTNTKVTANKLQRKECLSHSFSANVNEPLV